MSFDWLVVGAGFTGAILAERIASQLNQRVLLIDQRDHIGGNAYDYYDDHGVLVHKYGAHIFHTNSLKVWEYLSGFTTWRRYEHRVRASVDGSLVPVPFNLNSLRMLFPRTSAELLERKLAVRFGYDVKVPVLKLLDDGDPELRKLGRYVYDKVFEGYTVKQWGLKPMELDPSVTGRVPVFVSADDRYFQDDYQGIPEHGYTTMFSRMLAHPNIRLQLETHYREVPGSEFRRTVYTGPIDEFFDSIHGPLPYRSVKFDLRHEASERYQPIAVVNYPNQHAFTRIVEFKHMTGQSHAGTTLAYEYPEPYLPGKNEPYYPIPRDENRERYASYLREVRMLQGSVIFAGRLADYKYYNMDQAAGRALKVFDGLAIEEARNAHATVCAS